jgi:hypothetical protein
MHSAREPEQNSDFEAVRAEVEREFATEFNSKDSVNQEPVALPDIEAEIGLKQVDLEQTAIDTVAAEDTGDGLDADSDDVVDAVEDQEEVSNLPQEFTQSYGTGLQGQPGDRTGRYSRRGEHLLNKPDYTLTGGDVDANYEDAEAVGEEGVGGTVETPDQDVVDELAAAVGIETDDRSFLRTNDMLEERDDRRWELDPTSSEDYQERRD